MDRSIAPERSSDVAQMLDRAIGLHQGGQLAQAEKLYRSILRIKPRHVEARHFLGVLRFQQGRTDEALNLIETVLQAKPDYAEALYNRGNILAKLERYEDALSSYDGALALQRDNVEALYNRGNALFKLRRYQDALASYDRVLALQPRHVEALTIRGATLQELKLYDEALADYDRSLALAPTRAEIHYGRGNLLNVVRRFEESLASYATALALSSEHPDRFGIINPALATCDWSSSEGLVDALRADLMAGRSSVNPFTLVGYIDDPELSLRCAKNFVADRIPIRPPPLWNGTRYRHDRIRLAYLSADYREHATAHLMAELFELHDRAQFDVLGVSFGGDDGSDIRSRLIKSFDEFHDVRAESDRNIARLMCELEIDIAIDLKGHTRDARPEILANRAAPIQVGYLGYPGTIGADFLDYIIADPVVLPFEQQAFYTENIVHLPDCYQVNDRKRLIEPDTPSRQAAGLPEEAFVFCCFNNNFKIARPMFDVWMRLLISVPGSVLWLLRGNAGAERNLRHEAARVVDPARLIFADRCSPAAHLARHRLADLFVDTLPCNAHTTASDALWAGLPVVTCQGRAFPGRVAASLLNAIGLPELVTHSLADYEALARRLASDAELLQDVRARLVRNRLSHPLFDTDRFRRSIEAAYRHMWDTWQRGAPAQPFHVAADGTPSRAMLS